MADEGDGRNDELQDDEEHGGVARRGHVEDAQDGALLDVRRRLGVENKQTKQDAREASVA